MGKKQKIMKISFPDIIIINPNIPGVRFTSKKLKKNREKKKDEQKDIL